MSMDHAGRASGSADSSFKDLLILCGATIVCLIPWINKAFCIDDPLFLWSAAQIQAHPLDFYGCDVNWYSTAQPLYDVTKNPPLACYYLALAAAVLGWNEPALRRQSWKFGYEGQTVCLKWRLFSQITTKRSGWE